MFSEGEIGAERERERKRDGKREREKERDKILRNEEKSVEKASNGTNSEHMIDNKKYKRYIEINIFQH